MPPPRKAKGPALIVEGLVIENKQEAMALILDRLEKLTDRSGRSISELFMEAPDRDEYPDYYVIIETPMAFDMIRESLRNGEYKDENARKFGRDLKTMIGNAKKYNRDGSMVYRDAISLESYIDVALKWLNSDDSLVPKKEEFSAEFCHRVLDIIKSHQDESGRQVAELFLELPSEEDYPDYYKEITNPISIGVIEERIDRSIYPKLERFEKDVNLMFDNAKHYNAEGSVVYLDAETLQQLFWKTIGKNGRGRQTKGKRTRKHDRELQEVVHGDQKYRVGDFIHIQNDSEPSKPTIGLVSNLWQEEKYVILRKEFDLQFQDVSMTNPDRFYQSEVVKAAGVYEHLVSDIKERCFVLQTKDYIRGRPVNWKEGQSIYVCEQRYNESYKSVSKIKNWASCFPPGHKPEPVQLKLFPQPLAIKKLPSASMVDKAVKRDTSEPASRAESPSSLQDSSSSYASSREGTPKEQLPKEEHPKTTKSNKRKSAQIQLDSTSKLVTTLTERPEPDSQPPSKTRTTPSLQHRYRCYYANMQTEQNCGATFPSELELQQHVISEHANVSSAPALKRGRPKKTSSDLGSNIASPITPVATQPIESGASDKSVRAQSPYGPFSPTGPHAPSLTRPTIPNQVLSNQDMNSGATYSQTPQSQQQMPYIQQPQQRGAAYAQQPYDQPVQNEHSRPTDYTQTVPYNQAYGYGHNYPMQNSPQQTYSYNQTPYQQGYSSQAYNAQQQGPYPQPYSQP
ncbi:hypothetical protein BGZ65_006652, partial [Modicella reniformis]